MTASALLCSPLLLLCPIECNVQVQVQYCNLYWPCRRIGSGAGRRSRSSGASADQTRWFTDTEHKRTQHEEKQTRQQNTWITRAARQAPRRRWVELPCKYWQKRGGHASRDLGPNRRAARGPIRSDFRFSRQLSLSHHIRPKLPSIWLIYYYHFRWVNSISMMQYIANANSFSWYFRTTSQMYSTLQHYKLYHDMWQNTKREQMFSSLLKSKQIVWWSENIFES